MLGESVAVIGILFLLVLLLAPVFYYFNREKSDEDTLNDDK